MIFIHSRFSIIFALLLSGFSSGRAETTLNVTADSTLRNVLPELAQAWADSQPSMSVNLEFANAATMQTQLVQGKAGDVVIFASESDAKEAAKRGFVLEKDQKIVARNELVVFGRKALLKDEELDWYDLLAREWDTLALGNPSLTASGRAAQSAIKKHDLGGKLKGDGVHLGGNEADALNFVRRDEADAVFVLRSDLIKTTLDGYVIYPVDAGDYPAIRYLAAPAKSSPNLEAARSFIQFIGAKESLDTWKKWGFPTE